VFRLNEHSTKLNDLSADQSASKRKAVRTNQKSPFGNTMYHQNTGDGPLHTSVDHNNSLTVYFCICLLTGSSRSLPCICRSILALGQSSAAQVSEVNTSIMRPCNVGDVKMKQRRDVIRLWTLSKDKIKTVFHFQTIIRDNTNGKNKCFVIMGYINIRLDLLFCVIC